MRAVVQRVSHASVTISDKTKSEIDKGLVILLAVEQEDTEQDAQWLSAKIARMRIFPDEKGLMDKSAAEGHLPAIVVSQFTLYASTKKGNRPSFTRSARPDKAIPLYEHFVELLQKELGATVQTGEFGADMQVSLNNDGPVTIIIDSRDKE